MNPAAYTEALAASARGEHAAAIRHAEQALSLGTLTSAQRVACHTCLGKAYEAAGNAQRALAAYRQGLTYDGENAELLILLGNLYKRGRLLDAARDCYQKVLRKMPYCVEAQFNLAAIQQDTASYREASTTYLQVLAQHPHIAQAWHNLAACLAYDPACDATAVKTALRGFDEHVAAPLYEPRTFTAPKEPGKRLRVGYVSADFRAHPVGYLVLPIIERHDRSEVEVFCYFAHRSMDQWSEAIRAAADKWIDVAALDDAALARQIAGDSIDILVDLAGHSESNRLLAFARKPAPVQVTWMGYVTTTGMKAMDWRLTSIAADPAGCDAEYSEKLWRLPSVPWSFRPLPGVPDVSALPAARTGRLTFGVVNRFSKNSPLALAAWAEILKRVPDSRLLINAPPGQPQKSLASHFAAAGVDLGRIDTFPQCTHEQFWALHEHIDIALDPFPFNGGMTTCETLWQGVPVISCTGSGPDDFAPRFASRVGRSLLNAIGLGELAAASTKEYVNKAVALAADREKLAALRSGMRDRMKGSPLMDESAFAQAVEAAYRHMWRAYCEGREPNTSSTTSG